jgi:long-chain acyl-CoA synthetase
VTSRHDRLLEQIEARYRYSAYVKEICVMELTRDDQASGRQLYAVVVPDMGRIRQRRIVNIGDLLRFEIEGQSVHLPPEQRVLAYELWFEPLPRTPSGEFERPEIERRLREKQRGALAAGVATAHAWEDAHAACVAALIARRARGAVVPDANLEIDLALDSMDRVELIAALEHCFGVRVPEERAHDILTVRQLIEAVRPGQPGEVSPPVEDAWTLLLRDLPPDSDPVLSPILAARRVIPLLFFGALRVLRLFMPRILVSGLEQLPRRGPFIVSPNHQSYLDPFVLCSILPYSVFRQLFVLGAAEYFATPLTAWLARRVNLIPVDPDANLVAAMKAGAFGLTHGKILVLFPEGERSIDGMVKRFKKGAPILARHVGAPIVPVAVHGLFELWPRNRPFNWRLLVPGSGHRIRVAFGEPLKAGADDGETAAALRQRVVTLWEQLQALSGHLS